MICPYCKKEIEPVDEFVLSVTTVKDKNGNLKTWTEETRDIDEVLISKRVDDYSYFQNGPVDTIRLRVFDGENALISDKTVKHNASSGSISVDTQKAQEI